MTDETQIPPSESIEAPAEPSVEAPAPSAPIEEAVAVEPLQA